MRKNAAERGLSATVFICVLLFAALLLFQFTKGAANEPSPRTAPIFINAQEGILSFFGEEYYLNENFLSALAAYPEKALSFAEKLTPSTIKILAKKLKS